MAELTKELTQEQAKGQSPRLSRERAVARLVEHSPGCWQVLGDIDFDSVIGLRQQGIDVIGRADQVCRFDFSGVGSVNSMALSLILCWSRACKQAGIDLQLDHIPSELHAIAELSDLQTLVSAG